MEILFLPLGLITLAAVTIDIFWTSLWVDGGAGPLSKRISSLVWSLIRKIGRKRSSILSLGGPLTIMATLLMWILLTWAGWFFIFCSDPQSFMDTRDNMPISFGERTYFTGYLIFTLGIGDYVPAEGFWQVMAALAAGNGFLFITVGASYVLSVLGAVTAQRAFASSISSLGDTGSEVVKNAWNGQDFHDLDLFLSGVADQLGMLTAQHKAYPVLHFYHSSNPQQAASHAVAVLDEALTMIRFGIPESYQPNRLLVKEARASIHNYLETLTPNFVSSSNTVPPDIDVNCLRELGLPTRSREDFEKEIGKLTERRKKLFGIIKSDGRQWPNGE